MNKPPILWVKSIKPPAARPNPKHTRLIFVNRKHVIVAQAAGVIWDILIMNKLPCFSIEFIKSSPGSNPEHAQAVFINRHDVIAAQAMGIG